MSSVALAARLLLAAVFTAAAAGKLSDRAGSREAVREFGVAEALTSAVAILLPCAELLIALELVPASSAPFGAAAAFVLLSVFLVAIIVNLARGRRPDCNCFGQLHGTPLGPGIVVRNAILMALAATVVSARGGVSLPRWWDELSSAGRMGVAVGGPAALLLLVQGAVLWTLFVRYGRLLVRVDALEADDDGVPGLLAGSRPSVGLPIGSQAPSFELRGLSGERLTLAALLARQRPLVLLFTDPVCAPCAALLPEVAEWQRAHEARITIVIVSRGAQSANADKFAEVGVTTVLLQEDREVATLFLSTPTPSAVLVDSGGRIAAEAAIGADAIRRLVSRAVGPDIPAAVGARTNGHAPLEAAPLTIGDAAPSVSLPDLDGDAVELASMLGRDFAIVFWNPHCSFCTQLLPQLRDWDHQDHDDAMELLIVTTGQLEANRGLGFRSTVVLDDRFEVGPRFGANGTPMAVVVDADGRIASHVAIGGPAVMELIRTARI